MPIVCSGRKGGWFEIRRPDNTLEIFAAGCRDRSTGIEYTENTVESGIATHEIWGTVSANGATSARTLLNRSTVNLPGYYYIEWSSGYGRFRWIQTSTNINTVVGNWFRATSANWSVTRTGGTWSSTKTLTIDNKAGSFRSWSGATVSISRQICGCLWDECQSGTTGLDAQNRPGFCCYNCGMTAALLRAVRSQIQTRLR